MTTMLASKFLATALPPPHPHPSCKSLFGNVHVMTAETILRQHHSVVAQDGTSPDENK